MKTSAESQVEIQQLREREQMLEDAVSSLEEELKSHLYGTTDKLSGMEASISALQATHQSELDKVVEEKNAAFLELSELHMVVEAIQPALLVADSVGRTEEELVEVEALNEELTRLRSIEEELRGVITQQQHLVQQLQSESANKEEELQASLLRLATEAADAQSKSKRDLAAAEEATRSQTAEALQLKKEMKALKQASVVNKTSKSADQSSRLVELQTENRQLLGRIQLAETNMSGDRKKSIELEQQLQRAQTVLACGCKV